MRAAVYMLGGCASILIAAPADAQRRRQVDISPHVEVAQVLTADSDYPEVLTYTTISAGIDANVQTRRVSFQLSYNYEHRFSYDGDLADGDVHSGLARAAVAVAPGLTVEAGALATRARSDIRGDDPINLAGNVGNVSQVYSVYAGPTLATKVGPAAVDAGYRVGYTKAEAPSIVDPNLPGPALDVYDESTSHLATVSVGVKAGDVLPVGMSVSGAYQREDAGQLDQRFEGYYARGDVVLPVTRALALVAGVGYEKIEISQRDALRDANGDPVVDGNGRFVTDPNSPRLAGYDSDGVFYDGGIIYRPNTRLELEARVGKRYDTVSYTGSLSYQTSPRSGLQVGVYDSIDSFGRGLTRSVSELPTQFAKTADPFSDNYNGCVYGSVSAAAGGCLNGVLQSISTANFRARGIDGVFSMSHGPTSIGFGAGYANRRFYAPDFGPGFTVNALTDQSYYGTAFVGHALDRDSSVSGNLYVNYSDSGIAGAPDVWATGANAAYNRSFGRLGATASAGVYTFDQRGRDRSVAGQALLALGYSF